MFDSGARVMEKYGRRTEARGTVGTDPQTLFDYLDDPARFGQHMSRPSFLMPGSMHYDLDAREGRGVGAPIHMSGRILDLPVEVDEIVDAYDPGRAKGWHTIGRPRLLVLGNYRMGYEIAPRGRAADLLVYVDWDPLPGWRGALLERAARAYAAWCADSALADAQRRFGEQIHM